MTVLLHIIDRQTWELAQNEGRYAPDSVAREGFIHCSTPEQVLGVAENLYAGQTDLLLLVIDPARVMPRIVFEDCYESGQAFPHIYGPLNLNSVIDVFPFPPGSDGRFALPLRLQTEVNQPRLVIDDKVELRLLEKHHADLLFTLTDQSRAYLRPWMPWVDTTRSPADTRQFIEEARQQHRQNKGFHAGIWLEEELAGVIGFNDIDWTDQVAEIGYWLGESYQGRGLMTRACSALIRYAFTTLQLNRIEIYCADENRRSYAIPERLGFQREGLLRQAGRVNDRFVDHRVYGLLADEWSG